LALSRLIPVRSKASAETSTSMALAPVRYRPVAFTGIWAPKTARLKTSALVAPIATAMLNTMTISSTTTARGIIAPLSLSRLIAAEETE